MIAALIAMQVIQPQPTVRTNPVLATPNAMATARVSEPRRKLAQAKELLAHAEKVRATYAPSFA